MAGRIVAWVVGVVLAAMYAYLVIAGVGNLLGMSEMAGLMGFSLSGFGWFWLMFGIALPAVVFVLALLLGRRRRAGARVLMLAAGLALVAAIQLEVTHLVPQSGFFA